MSDRHSWLRVTPEDLARHQGSWKDGSTPGFNRGLPFNSSMRRKPMYATPSPMPCGTLRRAVGGAESPVQTHHSAVREFGHAA